MWIGSYKFVVVSKIGSVFTVLFVCEGLVQMSVGVTYCRNCLRSWVSRWKFCWVLRRHEFRNTKKHKRQRQRQRHLPFEVPEEHPHLADAALGEAVDIVVRLDGQVFSLSTHQESFRLPAPVLSTVVQWTEPASEKKWFFVVHLCDSCSGRTLLNAVDVDYFAPTEMCKQLLFLHFFANQEQLIVNTGINRRQI